MSTQNKFQLAETYLNSVVFERQSEITNMLACILSGQHGFMLGAPGIGKSYLITEFTSMFDDLNYFEKLMTAHTDTTEVFGPPSLKALRDDRFEQNTEGFLAEAHVSFLDEIWKSNSQVLNSLLTIMNERKFTNGSTVMSCPLVSVFAASNELPQDDSLGALYDRFVCRMSMESIRSSDNFEKMLLGGFSVNKPEFTLEELELAQAEVKAVCVKDCIKDLVKLRAQIKHDLKEKVYVSDRRWKQCLKFLQAVAWLKGGTKVDRNYFVYLLDCLWSSPDDINDIAMVLTDYMDPVVNRAQKLYNEAVALIEAAQATRSPDELGDLYKQIRVLVKEIEAKCDGEMEPHISPILDKLQAGFKEVKRRYMKVNSLI